MFSQYIKMISNISGERKLEVLKLVNYSNWFTNMGNKLKHETLVKVCMQKIGISLLPGKLKGIYYILWGMLFEYQSETTKFDKLALFPHVVDE
jgi:hypothetical protein